MCSRPGPPSFSDRSTRDNLTAIDLGLLGIQFREQRKHGQKKNHIIFAYVWIQSSVSTEVTLGDVMCEVFTEKSRKVIESILSTNTEELKGRI